MLDNANMENYCQERAKGKSQRKAYIAAYPKAKDWKPQSVDSKASNLEKKDKIKTRLRELAEENSQKSAMSRQNILEKLEKIINSKVKFKSSDVLKAIEIYAKLSGFEATPIMDISPAIQELARSVFNAANEKAGTSDTE